MPALRHSQPLLESDFVLCCQEVPNSLFHGGHAFVYPLRQVVFSIFSRYDVTLPDYIRHKVKVRPFCSFIRSTRKPSGPCLCSSEPRSVTGKLKDAFASFGSWNWTDALPTINSPPGFISHAGRSAL